MSSLQPSGKAVRPALERWSVYLTYCIMAIALMDLAGWQWDIALLKSPVHGIVEMKPLAAATFLLCSCSLLILLLSARHPFQMKGAKSLALLAGMIGIYAGFSNRIPLNTGLCFALTSLSLLNYRPLLAPAAGTRRHAWADLLPLLTGMLGLITLLGCLYRAPELYGTLRYLSMAIYTAICFGLLSLALLFANAGSGIMHIFTLPLMGSITARGLLPFAFLVPITLGFIRLYAYWYGSLSTELGVTLLVLSIITCFVGMLLYNAVLLNKRDLQRQKAEAEWQASESRWQLLVDTVKDYAIFLVDADGTVISWNDGAAAIKGYRPEEIIGKTISVFYTAEDIERNEPLHNLRMAEKYGTHHSEGWRLRKDGTRFWAEIAFTAIYDDDHTVRAFLKITRDTTEQKLDREKIAYLARLIEDTGDAVISSDLNYMIRSWNRAAETLYGFSASEAVGRPSYEVLHSPEDNGAREIIRQKLAKDGFWTGEGVYYNKTGKPLHTLLSVSETRDAEGKRDGYVMICRDMTEWKSIEEKLRQFNRELEAQVQEKTAVISQSNEELRALASRLQDIREEERAYIAREVHDELGQQLTGLKIDMALIGRKLETGEKEWLKAKITDTAHLLDTTIQTVRKIATELRPSIIDDLGLPAAIDWQAQEFEKRSGIRTHFSTTLAGIECQPATSIGLFRICQESLTNVARHSGATSVCILLTMQTGELTLTVQDDGKGFNASEGNKQRLTTLGLLGMKERAIMMGGKLDIKTKPGEGLTLSVTVPVT